MRKTVRELQKEQTKELLLQTAYEVFSKKGIMNTRVSDIARAAGVSHGTIFVHFRSLEAMIEEVVALYGQKIAMRTHALAQSSGSSDLLRAHLAGSWSSSRFIRIWSLKTGCCRPVRETAGYRSNPPFHFISALSMRENSDTTTDQASPCICCSTCGWGWCTIISKTEICLRRKGMSSAVIRIFLLTAI